MCTFSNRAKFFQIARRGSGKRFGRAALIASFTAWLAVSVLVGIADLAGLRVGAVPPVSAGTESMTENAAPAEWAYFPEAFANQGEAVAEIYIAQF